MASCNRRAPYLSRSRLCPQCKKTSFNFFDSGLLKCRCCERYKEIGICEFCNLQICERCVNKYSEVQEDKFEIKIQQSKTKYSISCRLSYGIGLMLLGAFICCMILKSEISVKVLTPDNLRSYFPSQKQETLFHILSILDMKFPTVKSLTLLHEEDNKTVECLVSKLIMMYTNDDSIKVRDISFENVSQEVKDYGEVLEYYRPIVEKYGIFVTDLNKISGNIARIFHSLCDEGSSPIKPSLFIFILRYDENTKHLKPLMRATTILKEAWQDLPSNELFPLLSRVVKNVIDVIPEKEVKC